MGVFNTLRVKLGTVLIVVIGLSILAFLIGDLLGPNSVLLGGNDNTVGEIAGQEISRERYQNKIEEFKYNFQLNTGRTPKESDMISIRNQAWQFLIVEIAFEEQYEELGLKVTDAELVDMVQGNNVSPLVKQAFTDPQTGEFNKEQVINIIRTIANQPAERQAQWYNFEASLVPARKRTKYDALIENTTYASQLEGKRKYSSENFKADVEYAYIPVSSIPDSAVDLSESKLKKYFNENKDKYESEATRTISYVEFDLAPSSEDSLYLRKELESLKSEFESVEDDSIYARSNSDIRDAYKNYHISDLPKILASNTNILENGDVLGPYIENNTYVLYKVSEIYDDTVSAVKASHVLIKTGNDKSDAEAKALAEEVLRKARSGQDFAELAKEYSDDGSAIRGGDLGWFKEGTMVPEFNDAAFGKNGTGLVNRVIESQFGYHVINVTEPKTAKSYKIARISREIIASDATRNEAFRKADFFKSTVTDEESFISEAEKEGYRVVSSGELSKNQRSIGVLGQAREIVRWSFTDAELGKVSKVFELDNAYVVALLTNKQAKGDPSFNSVMAQVRRDARKDFQLEMIKDRLAAINADNLEQIVEEYGAASKYNASISLNDTNLPTAGQAVDAIGTAFGLTINELSEPIESNNGVIVLKVTNRTEPGEIADYTTYREQILQNRKNQASLKIKAAIEENADIVDERYKIY